MLMKRVSTFLTVILLLVWLILFLPTSLGGSTSYIIVSGISMEPRLVTGDLVVLRKSDNYQLGDVIAYQVQNRNVVHRIVGGNAVDGFVTRGDNKQEDDPWFPKPDQILGKEWFFIPAAGKNINGLRSPQGLTALAGLAILVFWDEIFPEKKKNRRRKRMRSMSNTGSTSFQLPSPAWLADLNQSAQRKRLISWLMPLTLTLLGFGLIFLLFAIISYLRPTSQLEPVMKTLYERQVRYQYTVHTKPSPLYSSKVIGPIGPETDPLAEIPPIVSEYVDSIVIDMDLSLLGPIQAEISGEIKPVLQIQVGQEWHQNFSLGEPVQITGTATQAQFTLKMSQLREWVGFIEEQLGYGPSSYQVIITPAITLAGKVDGEAFTDAYASPFAMTFRTSQIQMEPELERVESLIIDKFESREQAFRLGNWSLPVVQAQIISLIGMILFLPAGVLLAGLLYLWLRNDEMFKLRLRYGSMLIPIANMEDQAFREIQVASMKDLARLAQRDGGVIFYRDLSETKHQFFIPDGQILYTYLVTEGKEQR